MRPLSALLTQWKSPTDSLPDLGNPHDKLFREGSGQPEIGADFPSICLPAMLVSDPDPTTLQLATDSLVMNRPGIISATFRRMMKWKKQEAANIYRSWGIDRTDLLVN